MDNPQNAYTAYTGSNLFTNVGRSALASVIAGNSVSAPNYIILGIGSNSASEAGASGLNAEIFRKRVSTRELAGTSARYISIYNSIEANGLLTELGLTNQATGGQLFAIANTDIQKTTAVQLYVTWFVNILN